MLKKIGLLPRLLIAIALGLLLGSFAGEPIVQILVTFTDLFGSFLKFVIPFIIIGFIVPGIADLGKGAGKILAITTVLAYVSTLIAGTIAYFTGSTLFPMFLEEGALNVGGADAATVSGLIEFKIPPIMDVTSALIFAFMIGLGIAALKKGDFLRNTFGEFQQIISKIIQYVIIPLLPIHVAGIFSKMAFEGTAFAMLKIFIQVFAIIICLHILLLIGQYCIAGGLSKQNPFKLIKNMLPAYFTAVGTQSSAATIPVTLQQTKANGVSDEVAEFAIPLCATIHLSGSTITLTCCALAIMMLNGMTTDFGTIFPFIMMLGVTMIAAPGAPGGAVFAAVGPLETMLAFDVSQIALITALYTAQDSFGTACNVTGDGAISVIVNQLTKKSRNKDNNKDNKDNKEEEKEKEYSMS